MNRREKAAGSLAVAGMLLTATDSLTAAIAGVALLGAGAIVLNWAEIRAHIKKKAARLTRRRHTKNYATTSYQKEEGMSR